MLEAQFYSKLNDYVERGGVCGNYDKGDVLLSRYQTIEFGQDLHVQNVESGYATKLTPPPTDNCLAGPEAIVRELGTHIYQQ